MRSQADEWNELADAVAGLGLKLKLHVEQAAAEPADEVNNAVDCVAETVDRAFDALRSAVQDPAVQDDVREVATRRRRTSGLDIVSSVSPASVVGTEKSPVRDPAKLMRVAHSAVAVSDATTAASLDEPTRVRLTHTWGHPHGRTRVGGVGGCEVTFGPSVVVRAGVE